MWSGGSEEKRLAPRWCEGKQRRNLTVQEQQRINQFEYSKTAL
jgi:hypothetical protein